MVALLRVHVDGLAVIVLRIIELREIQLGFSPALLKTDAENNSLASRPSDAVSTTWPFFSPKLSSVATKLAGPASSGALVMMLMVAKIPLLPYSAEDGPQG